MNLRDEDYLRHILDAVSAIESYVTEGEAVSKLSVDLKTKHADVPWVKIAGMRNRLIHGYLTVDQDVVWSTVVQVLPGFKKRIEELLRP